MEDFASNVSSNPKRDAKHNQEADPKTRVKPVPNTPLNDQSETSVSNIVAGSSTVSTNRFPGTPARSPTRVRKKKPGADASRSPASDSDALSPRQVARRSSNRDTGGLAKHPDEITNVPEERARVLKKNKGRTFLEGSSKDSFGTDAANIRPKDRVKISKRLKEESRLATTNFPKYREEEDRGESAKSPRKSVVSTEKIPTRREESTVATSERPRHSQEELTRVTEKDLKKDVQKYHSRGDAKSSKRRPVNKHSPRSSDKTKLIPKYPSMSDLRKLMDTDRASWRSPVVRMNENKRASLKEPEEKIMDSEYNAWRPSVMRVREDKNDTEKGPKEKTKDTENSSVVKSMVRINEVKEDVEKEPEVKTPIEYANFARNTSAFNKLKNLGGTPPAAINKTDAGTDQKHDKIYIKNQLDDLKKKDETTSLDSQSLKETRSTEPVRRQSLERSAPSPTVLSRPTKYGAPPNTTRSSDSKVVESFQRSPRTVPLSEWESDEKNLLYWTTKARERDVAEAQRRRARKEVLAQLEYEPYLHRQETLFTDFAAFMYVMNGLLGIGCLNLPHDFSTVGLAFAVVFFIFLAVVTCYCNNMWLRNEYAICRVVREPWLGIPRTVEYACKHGPVVFRVAAPCFRYFAVIVMIADCLVNSVAQYYMFQDIMKRFCEKNSVYMDYRLYCLILLPVLVLCSVFQNTKSLLVISIAAVLLKGTGAVMIIVFTFQETPHSDVIVNPAGADWRTFPVFLKGSLMALNNVCVVLFVERNMREPQAFLGVKGVMTRSVAVVGVILLLVGICCYTHFGQDVPTFVQDVFANNDLSDAIIILLGLGVIGSYLLNIYVLYDLMWQLCVKNAMREYPQNIQDLVCYSVKLGFIVFTAICVIVLPNVREWELRSEAISAPLLVLGFPALVEICLCSEMRDFGRLHYVLFKDLLMVIITLYCCIFGALYQLF